MRIQHNIPAMSAYRNYTNNNSALSKNLEKLSSGYKINRAGDDAAGLAISEKMRAQITGLEVAQKNAKDGISLIQTAEGALTEVHDMLNRMYELAEQSANGTYDDDVDRVQLQKEIDSLRTEINRIADSANFNGINLLDGSMSSDGVKSVESSLELPKVGTNLGVNTVLHKDQDSAAATTFSVDLSTVEYANLDDSNDFVLKIGDTEFKLAAGTGGVAAGTKMDANDIANAFVAGQFTLSDGTAMTAGEASFGDAEFTVTRGENDGRITFTQSNDVEFDPRMEVTVKDGTRPITQGRMMGRDGPAPEEPATGNVTGNVTTTTTKLDAHDAIAAVYESALTIGADIVAGNDITINGTGLDADPKYTVVDDSAEDFDAASFDAETQVKLSDVADAEKLAAWVATQVKTIGSDKNTYNITASDGKLVYTAKTAGEVGADKTGPAAAPTALTFMVEEGSATKPQGAVTVAASATTTAAGTATITGGGTDSDKSNKQITFSTSDDSSNAKLIALLGTLDSDGSAIGTTDLNLFIKTTAGEDGADPTYTLWAGTGEDAVQVATGTIDNDKKKITFTDGADSSPATILTASWTTGLTDKNDLVNNTLDTGIKVKWNGTNAHTVDVTGAKTDQYTNNDDGTSAVHKVAVSGYTKFEIGNEFYIGEKESGGTKYTVVADDDEHASSAGYVKASDIDTVEKFAGWLAGKDATTNSDYKITTEAIKNDKNEITGYNLVYTKNGVGVDDLSSLTVPKITGIAAGSAAAPTGRVSSAGISTAATAGAEASTGTDAKSFKLDELTAEQKSAIAAAAAAAEADYGGSITIQKVTTGSSPSQTTSLKLFVGETEIGTGAISSGKLTFTDSSSNELLTATVGSSLTAADVTETIYTGLSYTEPVTAPDTSSNPENVQQSTTKPQGMTDVAITPVGDEDPPAGEIKMGVTELTEDTASTGTSNNIAGKTLSIDTQVKNTSLNGTVVDIRVADTGDSTSAYSNGTITLTLSKTGGDSGKYSAEDITNLLKATTGKLPDGTNLSDVLGSLSATVLSGQKAVGEMVIDVNDSTGGTSIGTIEINGGGAAGDKQVEVTVGGVKYSQVVSADEWQDSEDNGTPLPINITEAGVRFNMNVQQMKADGWDPDTSGEITIAKIAGEAPDFADSAVVGDYNKSTTAIKEKNEDGGDRAASTFFDLTKDIVANGASITIAGDKYTFTNDKKLDGTDGYVYIGEEGKLDDLSTIAERLTDAAKENTSVYTVGHDGKRITVTETVEHAALNPTGDNPEYPADDDWDLSTLENVQKSIVFSSPAKTGNKLTLQIGDTSDSYNQLKVEINDCHADAMGIGKVDISDQAGASEAVLAIKKAINYVSDVRGTLGATQNRLDHTINNLSVMQENIQDAESTIRDVDVAQEMMEYTKNNILVQSAQAMLAQANQLPQGVLQLLQ